MSHCLTRPSQASISLRSNNPRLIPATIRLALDAQHTVVHQIIDGQQRLTSLFAAMTGTPVRDINYKEKRIKITFSPIHERFEVATPAYEKSASWVPDISAVFTNPMKARRDFLKRYRKANGEISEELEDRVEEVIQRLNLLNTYNFNVVHIDADAGKSLVADVFVRINSEGVRLASSDYILTWLSVFWPEGRTTVEDFARDSRITPQRASELFGHKVTWTPKNPFIELETKHIVRALVAVAMNRARLQDAYTALQAKDPSTGTVDSELLEESLSSLKRALPIVTDQINWTEFIHSVQRAGFRTRRNITSSMNFIYTYVLFLLGRTKYKVDLSELRPAIGRWMFMAQLSGRYTSSPESQLSKELNALEDLDEGDSQGFLRFLNSTINSVLTRDFWKISLPEHLNVSNPALSPYYQSYIAALNVLEARMFMLNMSVSDWLDPSMSHQRGLENHHLFPRNYLRSQGITDIARQNQAANFAPTDWHTNNVISDRSPAEYWPDLVSKTPLSNSDLDKQRYWHALPEDWHLLPYDVFLEQRRVLMAAVIEDAFEKLSTGQISRPSDGHMGEPDDPTVDLRELFDAGLLKANQVLDAVDPNWKVDAVITADGTIEIDGEHAFDSLDAASRHLEVDNLTGLEFWALEDGEDLIPLSELAAQLN